MLNFEAVTLKFCNLFWKLGCQPKKREGKPMYDKWFESFDLFVFFIVPQRLVSNAKRKTSKSNKSELTNCLSYKSLPYFFQGWQPNSQKWLQNFEVTASKFNIDCPLTSMTSNTAALNILKLASNHCISSKYWWKV